MSAVSIDQALQIAMAHLREGRCGEAEGICRQILGHDSRQADALHLLGLVAAQCGHIDAAIEWVRKAIEARPHEAMYQSNLGKLLADNEQLAEACAACRRALELDPHFADAYLNLGRARFLLREYEASSAAYRALLNLRPDDAYILVHLGECLLFARKFAEAADVYRTLIRLQPEDADTHNHLGLALFDHDADEAIVCYRQALRIAPFHADALNNLANALKDTGQIEQALPLYRKAASLRPGDAGLHSNIILSLHYHPASTQESLFQEARAWNQKHAAPWEKSVPSYSNDPSPDRPLRIGYVSADFRNHVVGRNILPLLAQHDHRKFHITCFSDVAQPDNFTEHFRTLADQWHSIVGCSDEQVAQSVHDHRIDILVDLAQHSTSNRLLTFARKPAPVQVNFAGYPCTTGLTAMDYRLTDPHLDPPAASASDPGTGCDDEFYSETSIRLSHSFWCYRPFPGETTHPVSAPPVLTSGQITFGCLNNFAKIHDGMLDLWAKVLARVPDSRLMLRTGHGRLRQHTLDLLARHGVTPQRVEFQAPRPHGEYLELYHLIDIVLDTVPYNGHTTALDALWMGVPIVSLVGPTIVGRAGLSQLSNLGLTELIAYTPEQYIAIAAGLAADLPRLADLRKTLRQRMMECPLTDAAGFAKSIEEAYRRMWEEWSGGGRFAQPADNLRK